VALGVSGGIAGFALTHLRERVGTDNAGISLVFVLTSVGYVLGSFGAGRGLDAGHGHRRWAVATAVLVASWGLVAATTSLVVMLAAFFAIGLAAGVCDASGNTLVVWSRPDGPGGLLNALHLSFAAGVMVTPIIVRVSLDVVDRLWIAVGVLAVLGAVSAWLILGGEQPVRGRAEVVERSEASGARGRHVALVCLFFFAYVAYETTFLSWILTYTEEIGYARAATGVSFMAGLGFAVGRVIAVPVAGRVSPGRILAVTLVASLVVLVPFLVVQEPGATLWVVSFLFGAAVAPQYAAMMGYAEAHLALSGRNTAAIVACSGMGGLVIPRIVGELFDRRGPDALPVTMLVLGLLAAATAVVIARTVGGATRAAAADTAA
jgi:fucose permease